MAENPMQRYRFVSETYKMDGQPFSEMAWLANSYTYNFMCVQSAHVHVQSAKRWSCQNPTSLTVCYSNVLGVV